MCMTSLSTPTTTKWLGESIYIDHQVHRAVAPTASKNQHSIGFADAYAWGASVKPVTLSQHIAIELSDMLLLLTSNHRLNRCITPTPIGSTGAEDVVPCALTCSLDNAPMNALMPHFMTVGSNGRIGLFFTWLGTTWAIARTTTRRSIRCPPV
jgi:hypothetical protein